MVGRWRGRERALDRRRRVGLIPLLAVIGLTILFIGQLLSVHLFVGMLLIGPVGLKLASTGYRFVRYYSGNEVYRRKGPPELWLRMIAPVVVLSTLVVFVSGVLLLLEGSPGGGCCASPTRPASSSGLRSRPFTCSAISLT